MEIFSSVSWQIFKVILATMITLPVLYFAWRGFCDWAHIKDEPVDQEAEDREWQKEQHRWWG